MLSTGAPSLRTRTKRNTQSTLRRTTSSPFSGNPRRKPTASLSRSKSTGDDITEDDALFDEPLDDTGVIASLAIDISLKDVAQFTANIHGRMFDPIPDRASGMSSTRTAEVLNFRKNMPPIVTLAHVHAVSHSTTRSDREIAELLQAGISRRLIIPNRGKGSSDVGECLVLTSTWAERIQSQPAIPSSLKEKYTNLLKQDCTSLLVSSSHFTREDSALLTSTGFLTSPTNTQLSTADLFARPGAGTFSTLTSLAYVGHTNATGSAAATGGRGAFTSSGGSAGGAILGPRTTDPKGVTADYKFSLPSTGPFLKLLTEARAHLLSLLARGSKHREAPLTVLRERWDGGVAGKGEATRAKAERGEFGVLPGKTKKWRVFYGLRFEWILEECVGAGLVECFETGSVGVGVRGIVQ